MVEQRVVNASSQVELRYASFETRLVAFVLDVIVLCSRLFPDPAPHRLW